MRRTLCVLAIALAWSAFAGSATAPGKGIRADVRGICNVTGIDIYFWPQGHPAIPAIGFPAFGPPHVELYKPRNVTNAGALGYLDVANSQLSGASCTSAPDAAMAFVQGVTPQTTAQTQKLRCTLTANVEVRVAPWTKVTRRTVVRTIRVKGKKKKVRRTIRSTVRVGNLATVGVSGTTGAVADVRVSGLRGTSSTLKWDPRVCAPVDVAG